MTLPSRSATIKIEQLPNGYWYAYVRVSGLPIPDVVDAKESFHNAGEALDWARMFIETTTASIFASPPIYRMAE